MKSRRAGAFLLGVAALNVFEWGTFIRNLAADTGRPTAFYVAHAVLIVVNLGMAVGLAGLGLRIWRSADRGVCTHGEQPHDSGAAVGGITSRHGT